jgi:Bacterial translation initiation factor IF-2 associated region./Translation initiation factor IF-2, N-terminal region.
MSDKTVKELAEMVKIPLERFLEQLKAAGISAFAPDDLIDEEGRVKLLAHLRKRHGKVEGDEESPKKITLKRRQVTELKQSTAPGVAIKTVNVEVRKKKTYIKRSDSELTAEQKEIEHAKQALADQQQQIASEESERLKHEQSIKELQEESRRKAALAAEKPETKAENVTDTEPAQNAVKVDTAPVEPAKAEAKAETPVEAKAEAEAKAEEPQLSEEEQLAKKLGRRKGRRA